jgi:transcriptional regulator with XRE-family HTH domain
MVENNKLGEWLDRLIEDEYGSNRKLAAKTGLSEATIRRIRSGEMISLRTLKKLSRGLNIPLEELEYHLGVRERLEGSRERLLSILEVMVMQMSDEQLEDLEQFARYLLAQQQKRW